MARTVTRGAVRALVLGAAVGIAAACGAGAERSGVEHPVAAPDARQARHRALREAGERIYAALADADPGRLLMDDLVLRRVLVSEAATRMSVLHAGLETRLDIRPGAFSVLDTATYRGICVQGSRVEPAGSPLGLRHDGWMFDRALVAGQQPSGRRIGAWVEGQFLYTNAGFRAISLGRVEEPRWEHSDLELAPCDMEVGLRGTPHVVGVTP